jgi:hypothetical protein
LDEQKEAIITSLPNYLFWNMLPDVDRKRKDA